MSDSTHQARLIPTSGIDGADEQERSATSALLAVIGAVTEFGRGFTEPMGAPPAEIDTFVEVPFVHEGRTIIHDGLIRVRDGEQIWTALVQVRIGRRRLDRSRVELCLDVAREQGLDAVLTISNDVPGAGGRHPVRVHDDKLQDVELFHYAWNHLLIEAVEQQQNRGVADPDQAWVLGELIRYLRHPGAGVFDADDSIVATHTQDVVPPVVTLTKPGSRTAPGATAPGVTAQQGTTAQGEKPDDRAAQSDQSAHDQRTTKDGQTMQTEQAGRIAVPDEETTATPSRTIDLREGAREGVQAPALPSRREVRIVRQLARSASAQNAGWYQDPDDACQLRWWDGTAWSESTYRQPALA